MTARHAYERATYLEDIKALQARGLSKRQIAAELHISPATLYRILAEARTSDRS